MTSRSVRTPALLLGVSLILGFTQVGTASGAPSTGCSVERITPREVVLGPAPMPVQFDVETDCDDADVFWFLTVANREPGPFGWLLLANFRQEPSSRYTYDPDGYATVHRPSNDAAGEYPVNVTAFVDSDGDPRGADETFFHGDATITIKRRSTFGSTFNASPEPRRRGEPLRIAGQLSRADWDTGSFTPFPQQWVQVQFKPHGARTYRHHSWARSGTDGWVTVDTSASRSGTWRMRFSGDSVSGTATTKGDYVKVRG